jgi:hypothetical protein
VAEVAAEAVAWVVERLPEGSVDEVAEKMMRAAATRAVLAARAG